MSNPGYLENWQSDKSLTECNMHMLTSEIACDVSFRVGEERALIQAHRYLLISRSYVFSAMFCGPLAEKEAITISDVSTEEFRDFLRYIYTDTPVLTPENATTMLYLAKKYAVGGLERLSVAYLEACLSTENACIILEQAHGFGETGLYQSALKYIQKAGVPIFNTSAFKDLCPECFRAVVTSGEFLVSPEDVFKAALTWAVSECWRQDLKAIPINKTEVLGSTLYDIYFPDMNESFFVKHVVPSKVLTEEDQVKILSYYLCSDVNISPFKTRHPKKPPQPKEKPIPTFQFDLYDKHVRSKVIDPDKVTEDIYITPFSKVHLRGFCMHGSGRQHMYTHKYHVKIFRQKLSMGTLLHDLEVTLDADSNTSGISECRLVAPITLEAGVSYHFQLRLLSGDPPLFIGHKPRASSNQFSTKPRPGHSLNIISGLICSDIQPRSVPKPQTPQTICVHL